MAGKDVRPESARPASPQGPPPKPDWRSKGKAAAGPGGAADRRAAGWATRTDQEYRRARLRYRIKVGAWIATLAGLLAFFIIWLSRRPEWTPFLAMESAAEYDGAVLPPNGWAAEDLRRFAQLGTPSLRILNYSRDQYALGNPGLSGLVNLHDRLAKTRPGGPNKNVIVVYLSLHGAVDAAGEPCLIPPGVSPYDSRQWLPLEKVIHYLFPKELLGRFPRKALLLVALDACRMDENWRLGLLYNGFADRLEEVRRRVDIPQLAILNSTSPGQVGWTSPEKLHGSVFAYYFDLALQGAADSPSEGGNGDWYVSLQEVHRYLARHVGQWVRDNRDDDQAPMLLAPESAGFYLVDAKSHHPAAPDLPIDAQWTGEAERELAALWEKHRRADQDRILRLDPVGWEQFQQCLLRLEQLSQAGDAFRERFEITRRKAEQLADSLPRAGVPNNLAAHSLPLAQQRSTGPEIERQRQVLLKSWNEAAGAFQVQQGQTYDYLPAAQAVWERLQSGVPIERWPSMFGIVDQAARRPPADVVELHFARMMQSYLDPVALARSPDLIRSALLARQAAEQAAAPVDGRVQYWIEKPLDHADEQRRLGEDRWFVGGPSSLLKTAEDSLSGAREGYQRAMELAGRAAEAYRLRDRSWAVSPYLAQWLFHRLASPSPAQLKQLDELVVATHELGAELEAASKSGLWTAKLATATQTVKQNLAALEDAYQQECSDLWLRAGQDKNTLRRILVVLSVPLATGETRMGLRSKYRQIAATVEQRSPGSAAAQSQSTSAASAASGGGVTPSSSGEKPEYLARILQWQEQFWDQHPALGLLNRDYLSLDVAETVDGPTRQSFPRTLTTEDARARTQPERLAAIYQQGEEVRRLLRPADDSQVEGVNPWRRPVAPFADYFLARSNEKLQEKNPEPAAVVRTGRSKADRAVRAAAALLDLDQTPWDDRNPDAARQLQRLDDHYLMLWQAYRALEDFWGPRPGVGGTAPYFQIVASDYLRSARDLCPKAANSRYGDADLAVLLETRSKAAVHGIVLHPKDLELDQDQGAAPLDLAASIRPELPRGEAAVSILANDLVPLRSEERLDQADLRRLDVAVPGSDSAAIRRWIGQDNLAGESGRLQAVALYRGNLWRADFGWIRSSAGISIAYQPPNYSDPRITVHGTATEQYTIMFILDYSDSMLQEMPLSRESTGAGVELTKRYIVARRALNEILGRLAQRGDRYNVGVMVYGHRVGWGVNSAGQNTIQVWDPVETPHGKKTIRDPANPGLAVALPPGMPRHPSNDVEMIQPPVRFSRIVWEGIRQKLERLEPIGETPLYYAIQQAAEQLRQASRTSECRIVVITDGVNERFGEIEGTVSPVFAQDVGRALRPAGGSPVRLDVVGFQLTDQDFLEELLGRHYQGADLQNRLRELRAGRYAAQEFQGDLKQFRDNRAEVVNTARASGGDFYSANDLGQLVHVLEQSLQLSKFQVRRVADGQIVTPEPVALEEPATITQGKNRKIDYQIELLDRQHPATTQVTLEGGEALELWLSEDRNRLEHRRYDAALRDRRESVPDPANPSAAFFVGAHLPWWDDRAVVFDLSIQNSDPTRFSPRPAESWVEIRPVMPDRSQAAPQYLFYDRKFVDARPVPVLECKTPQWPLEAKEAQVQLWFKSAKTRPDQSASVDDLVGKGEFHVEGQPEVTLKVAKEPGDNGGPCRVVVVERHPLVETDLGQLKVEMDPPAKYIVHRFNPKTAIVRHDFFYDGASYEDLSGYRVNLTRRESLMRGAVILDKPLRVEVPPTSDSARP